MQYFIKIYLYCVTFFLRIWIPKLFLFDCIKRGKRTTCPQKAIGLLFFHETFKFLKKKNFFDIQRTVHRDPSIHPFIRPSVCLSVCLSVFLSVCLSVYLSIYLSIYLSMYLWRYSPFRALASLTRRLQSSLFVALLHPLDPSSCSASLWTTSAHLFLGLPAGLVVWKFPFGTFYGIRSSSILIMWPAHSSLLPCIVIIFL